VPQDSEPRLRIAIDGPASSGKGTVARLVARALGYAYVDTGAMYRCIGLACERQGVAVSDAAACTAIAAQARIHFEWDGEVQRVFLGGDDVSQAIRRVEIGQAASDVAVLPGVRSALLDAQRALGGAGGVVMDGRDIGTVVLPEAELKIFLVASLQERARRRWAELARRGTPRALAEVEREIELRDAQDSGRSTAPLTQAEDAVRIDSTHASPSEVAAQVEALARVRLDGLVATG